MPAADAPRGSVATHARRSPRRPYAAPIRAQLDCPAAWRTSRSLPSRVAGVVVDAAAPVGISVAPGRAVSATVDDWSVASLPHLLVGVWPYAVEVGPWAAPGVGPCARCVAAAVLDEGSRDCPAAIRARCSRWRRARPPATWRRGRGARPRTPG